MKTTWQKTIVAAGTLLFGWVFFRPLGRRQLQSVPKPVRSYRDATARIAAMQEQERPIVREEGRTILLTHQEKTEWVVILLHGYTNCPQQFRELGKRIFERGCNVFIPRMPHHGLPDPLTKDHARLTAAALTTYTDTVIDLADGLGNKIGVVGISAGGTMAGWAALTRNDIQHSVLISPVFGYYGIPSLLARPLMHLFLTLPNFFGWWDATKKATLWRPRYVYPRYAMHTLAEILRLGYEVQHLLHTGRNAKIPVTFIINKNDHAVSNEEIYQVMHLWQKKNNGYVSVCEFDEGLELDHDIVDPEHEKQKTDLIYPAIMELVPFTA